MNEKQLVGVFGFFFFFTSDRCYLENPCRAIQPGQTRNTNGLHNSDFQYINNSLSDAPNTTSVLMAHHPPNHQVTHPSTIPPHYLHNITQTPNHQPIHPPDRFIHSSIHPAIHQPSTQSSIQPPITISHPLSPIFKTCFRVLL